MVVGCTGMLAYLSPQLAIVSVAVFPPVASVGVMFGRKMKRQQKEVQKALAASSSVAEEVGLYDVEMHVFSQLGLHRRI